MRILIAGGHGFVGKNLTKALEDSPHEVSALSRRDGFDLSNLEITKKYLADLKPDVLFNCAAHGGSLHYVTAYAADVLNDNSLMTLNLYKAVKEVCPQAHIVNPLSNCSYPGDADVHSEPEWWDGEVHPSVFSYGNAKRFVYVTSHCYKKQGNIRTSNFLVPNTFGPGDHLDPNKTHALNGMIIRMIQAHRQKMPEFEIWGTGSPIREWAYIDDVVAVMKDCLNLDQDLSYPVNIAQNHGFSIKESAQMIAKAVGYEGKLTFNPSYQDGAPKKILDNKNFRKLFPDFKFMDHQEGIRRTVQYYESAL